MIRRLIILLLIVGCEEPEEGCLYDCEGNCNGDARNDCAGDCGGTAVLDECGLCSNLWSDNSDSIVGNWEILTLNDSIDMIFDYLQISNDTISYFNIATCMDNHGNPIEGDCVYCFSGNYTLNLSIVDVLFFNTVYNGSNNINYSYNVKNDHLTLKFVDGDNCEYGVYKPTVTFPECD